MSYWAMENEIFVLYGRFLGEAEFLWNSLFKHFKSDMACGPGCSQCCTNLSVLPVEWAYIRLWLKERDSFSPEKAGEGSCPFLFDRTCAVYQVRPLICRLHGLPLMYLIEEYDAAGHRIHSEDWQITWCDLNFLQEGDRGPEFSFSPETVVNMENQNRELGRLNNEFLETPEGRAFRPGQYLLLSDLLK